MENENHEHFTDKNIYLVVSWTIRHQEPEVGKGWKEPLEKGNGEN